jgi:hypothetical protein
MLEYYSLPSLPAGHHIKYKIPQIFYLAGLIERSMSLRQGADRSTKSLEFIELPDNRTLIDLPEKLISGLNISKGSIKFRHIVNHAIYPDFCW